MEMAFEYGLKGFFWQLLWSQVGPEFGAIARIA